MGNDFVGTGVNAGFTRRITDDLIARAGPHRVRRFKRADAFVDLAEALDNLLGGRSTPAQRHAQGFANARAGRGERSVVARGAAGRCLAEARNTVARFEPRSAAERRSATKLRSRMSADADQISALGASIAELNQQVTQRPGPNPSPDLLDKRDQMLEDLSGLVQVSVSTQSDGTISVFIGSGQVLVLGTSASKLVITSGNLDPSQPQLVLQRLGSRCPDHAIPHRRRAWRPSRFQPRDARVHARRSRPHRGRARGRRQCGEPERHGPRRPARRRFLLRRRAADLRGRHELRARARSRRRSATSRRSIRRIIS